MTHSENFLSRAGVAFSLLALSCGTRAASSMGGSGGGFDAAAPDASKTDGATADVVANDTRDGTGGAAGSGGAAGAAGQGGGRAGASGSAGRGGAAGAGGSNDGGGAAGSAGTGQDASAGDADAARDTADASSDATMGADGDADSLTEAAADVADTRTDASAPPVDGATDCTPFPTSGVYATFRVVSDVFHVSITNLPGIDQALALWRRQSQANIPVGQLECGNGTYNCGWSWRMNPASITFAEITIEVCDATPSHVQNNCSSFPSGQYCPWSAELIALRDCRTDVACPLVPR